MTQIGTRSPECHTAEWLPGAPAGNVGATFRGHNRSGRLARWTRRCEVTQADPGSAFAFRTLPERFDPSRRDSTTWSYALEPVDGGTRVTHAYAITLLPLRPFRALFGVLARATRAAVAGHVPLHLVISLPRPTSQWTVLLRGRPSRATAEAHRRAASRSRRPGGRGWF